MSRWNSIVLHIPKTVWRCENYYATQYCEVFQFRQPNFSRRRSNLKRNFEVVFLQNHVVVLHNWIKFYMKSHLDLNHEMVFSLLKAKLFDFQLFLYTKLPGEEISSWTKLLTWNNLALFTYCTAKRKLKRHQFSTSSLFSQNLKYL